MDASLLAWIALAFLLTITPGPDTLLVVGHAMKNGVRAGLAAVAGICAGFLWYAALAGFGFIAILAASPAVFTILKVAGALYLAWIGVAMIAGATRPPTEEKPVRLGAPFRQGLLTNALNPKIGLFYLAVLPQFVGAEAGAPLRAVALVAIHYVIGGLWLAGVALAAARAGVAVRRTRAYRWLEGLLGAAFIGLGVRLLLERRA